MIVILIQARRMRPPMDHYTGDGTCREYKRTKLRGHHTCHRPPTEVTSPPNNYNYYECKHF